jgi:phage gp16-like protein
MSTAVIKDHNRKNLIAKIHIAKKQLGLGDENYRALLLGETGKDSCAILNMTELEQVLNRLTALGFKKTAPKQDPKKFVQTDQVRKIRALWLNLYHLGELNDPSEEALLKFVKRMSNISALAWLTPAKANMVIKALRGWLERVGYDCRDMVGKDQKMPLNDKIQFIKHQSDLLNLDQDEVLQPLNESHSISVLEAKADQIIRTLGEKIRMEKSLHGKI